MKKVFGMVVLLAMVAMFVVPAFADEATDNKAQAWFDQMFQNKKTWVDQAVKDGRLTTEQGKLYEDHFDQMYKFHQENGYACPMGGPGLGGGMGYGRGFGSGMGPGMGYGPGYNAQQ